VVSNPNSNPNGLFSVAALMLDSSEIKMKFTRHRSGQKLTNNYTKIDRPGF